MPLSNGKVTKRYTVDNEFERVPRERKVDQPVKRLTSRRKLRYVDAVLSSDVLGSFVECARDGKKNGVGNGMQLVKMPLLGSDRLPKRRSIWRRREGLPLFGCIEHCLLMLLAEQ